MKINVYSVFDVKAAVFAHPFFMPGDGVAVRGFSDAVNGRDSALSQHPEDYSLFRIGSFEDSVGKLEAECPPVMLCTAASVKKAEPLPLLDLMEKKDNLPVGGSK